MAATWKVTIQVTNLAQREVNVTATRTDGEDVRTYSVQGKYDTQTNTPQQLLAAYTNVFWDLYQADVARETQIGALKENAETALANALAAKEN